MRECKNDVLRDYSRLKSDLIDALKAENQVDWVSSTGRVPKCFVDNITLLVERHMRDLQNEIQSIVDPDRQNDFPRASDRNPLADSRLFDPAEFLNKFGLLREALDSMEQRHRTEICMLEQDILKYKDLLLEAERKLVAGRVSNRKLRLQMDRLGGYKPYLTSRSHSCRPNDVKAHTVSNFGYGALSVRSLNSCRKARAD